ncbi:MAG: pyrophosphohydrolaseincluding oxidative damage repair enzyme [Herbaspirillum sp.]|nr:pyrophosphohydrolaseincluding oxidative damage repair enzyme [Herbaspirillum sp.]
MIQDLSRFVNAQRNVFQDALEEIKSGRKRSHWMWFIFPQLYGLGQSEKSKLYGIRSLREANDYLTHPILGQRLEQATRAVLESPTHPSEMFGEVDYQKFISCMTLFKQVAHENSVFASVLQKFCVIDTKTIELLGENNDKL